MKNKKIIGRTDKADFPDWGLKNIDIKIDTGAYTSSIHCHHIEETELEGGVKAVKFRLLDPSHPEYAGVEHYSTKFRQKMVRSSNGFSQRRYLVTSTIRLFEKNYVIELTLTERGEMRYPILIGRKLLTGKFVVDTSQADVSYNYKLQKSINNN